MYSPRPNTSAVRADNISTRIPNTMPASQQEPLTLNAFEQCRQILLRTFTSCDEVEYQHISCALTCVLSAVRPLRVSELQGGISIYSSAQYRSNFATKMSKNEFVASIKRHQYLFVIGQDETVSFSHRRMATFLRSYRIKGVDASNRTIAMICRAQIKAYRNYDPKCQYSNHAFAFLNYAERYHQYHYRIAMRSSLSLGFDRPEASTVSNAGTHGWQEQFAGLQVEDDWVLVKSE